MTDIAGNRIKVLIKEYSSGEYVEDVTPDLMQADWTFKAQGGIEQYNVVLARTTRGISGFSCPVVEIWCQDADNSWAMVVSGICSHMIPGCAAGRIPTLTLSCAGYLQQLHNVYLDRLSWTSTDVDAIMEDIIDNYVAADTDISRWTAKTTAGSGLTIENFEFDGTAYGAIAQLAEWYGAVEWGVMPQFIGGTWYPAKFYFVDVSTTVYNHFHTKDMAAVDYDYNLSRIRNSFILRGDFQTDDGDTLDTTEDDTTSQTDYGKRLEIVDNPFIDNATDATAYLEAIEGALISPGRGLGIMLPSRTMGDRMERNTPMGGSLVWDLFSDTDAKTWFCNAVAYSARRDGKIDMNVNLGSKLGVRQIFAPSQPQGPGMSGGRNFGPSYGRGGYNPLNPNYHDIDWGRPTSVRGRQNYRTREYWDWYDNQQRAKKK